jgi:hemolysin activation/secretion protein
MTFGHLNLSGNASDLAVDQAPDGPMRNGDFTKWDASVSRLQHIATHDSGLLSAAWQISGSNLDSAEKFGMSGPTAVRAYGPNEGNGDEGFLATLEWHHDLSPGLQGIAFIDTGRIRRDHTVSAATALPNTYHLSGTGLGANWIETHGLEIHAAAAWRLGSDPIRDPVTGLDSDGTKRIPHFWVTLLYNF